MSHATLLVIQGQDQGARFKLTDVPLGIGRGVRNEIRLLDTEISRQHALIRPTAPGEYAIADRGSSNGTYVNGQLIKQVPLRDGDRIQIGRSVMLFSRAENDESRDAAALIDLITHGDLPDNSQIVGRVGRDTPASGSTIEGRPADISVLYRITEETVVGSTSVEQLLGRVLDLTMNAVNAERGCVLLTELDSEELQPVVARTRKSKNAGKIPVSHSIVTYALRSGQGLRTSDARRDSRFDTGQSILQAGIREALCVPLQGRHSAIGVIYLDTTTPMDLGILSAAMPTTFADEHLRLVVAIGRQIALAVENQRYQQALVKAERLAAMGQTIALLSHHIKNILQGVRGGSYLIDMGLGNHNEDLVRKGWAIVEKNQGKIYHLVMDMLTFSKERQPVLTTGDLNALVNDIGELMQARAEECGVLLEWETDPALGPAVFDAEGIHRAVLNVVINAIDAVEGSTEGHVMVRSAYDAANDLVSVSVSDNGPGIPAEKLYTIFNIFESTKGARGTGLGLAVSRKILREHGGEILVESEPGQGCTFLLTWPRQPDEEHKAAEGNTQA